MKAYQAISTNGMTSRFFILATDYNDESKHGRIVAILSLAWTIASILYVAQGYIVEHAPGWMYIIIRFVICLFSRVMLTTCFRFHSIDIIDIDDDIDNDMDDDMDDDASINGSEKSITNELEQNQVIIFY